MRTALTIALFVLATLPSCGNDSTGASYPGRETLAGGIPLLDAAGVHAELERLRGAPLLVNCWAMWCPPCVEELPDLQDVSVEMREAGGEVVALCVEFLSRTADVEKTEDRLPRFVARRELTMPVWLYTGRSEPDLWAGMELPHPRRGGGIPVTLAIDKAGKVVDFVEGRASRERLGALMRAATK